MNILLIGYRGTGKTTVARLLGDRLGWPWLDADERLEERAGCSIREIFAERGEGAFRDLESEVLAELVGCERTVLSLGGGVVLREENRRRIAAAGRVVWLRAAAKTLDARIHADPSSQGRRPNLTVAGGLTEIGELLAQREPLYRQLAHLQVDTENKTPAEVAAEIFAALPPEVTRT